ncbi:hypothetical protein SEA_SKOG_106 [Gordonia phage Skog]|uniref:Uncharacterized protein n=1 Tax=Gordonia phage Skog TaxID=2704033 RepID=A0A6G6XJI7_9CAUD|nr:hypothetical protein KHQ85_gp106 [Gordonia phage Skog]QIG58258.1 hypothetical protein SEA_SKOG_106 [Gordonia phage Skog]
MAGSYNHAVDQNTGKLYDNESFVQMVENLGDAYETVEEMYGMIWFLAAALDSTHDQGISPRVYIEFARQAYREGLAVSPGTDGQLPEEG